MFVIGPGPDAGGSKPVRKGCDHRPENPCGGSGANSNSSNRQFELADNFDFNVGKKQQMRVGALLEGGRYEYFDESNANGTFTFPSLAVYQAVVAGQPAKCVARPISTAAPADSVVSSR